MYDTFDDASDPPPADGGSRWYVDASGIPWALHMGEDISHPEHDGLAAYPAESVRIDQAFPEIIQFFASGGNQSADWYLHTDVPYLYAPIPEPALWALFLGALAAVAVRAGATRSIPGKGANPP